jgi:hypothetical protein
MERVRNRIIIVSILILKLAAEAPSGLNALLASLL